MTQTAPSPSASVLAEAEALKSEANQLFQSGKYVEAEKRYSEAILLNPGVPAYWSNRSFAHIKLENYGYAIRDADEALKLDSSFIKAYYRRASARMALSRFKEALKDLRMVVKYAPQDPDARKKLIEVEKIVKKADFERALAYEAKRSVVESIQLETMPVEEKYDGCRWEDDAPLTLDFVKDMMDRFEKEKKIHKRYAYRILLEVKKMFEAMPTLVDVPVPQDCFTICGDVHGQYYDLLNIFRTNGLPSRRHGYLFNGDFVDRGSFSAEVIFTLLAFKCLYPDTFFMARGNHETDSMNKVYGFEGEIKSKYSDLMFNLFSEVFCAMPVAHVIARRLFVVHGGLFSRDDVTLDELRKVDRLKQPENEGLLCEMLWADPQPQLGRSVSKRGVGLQFGPDVTRSFLDRNNLDLLIRSHEVKEEGYVKEHEGRCVTVFSAPNYCDQAGNLGAYINVRTKAGQDAASDRPELDLEYKTFTAVPHPNVKPMQFAGPYGGMFGF